MKTDSSKTWNPLVFGVRKCVRHDQLKDEMQQGTQITWQTNLPLNFKVCIKMVEFLDAAEEEVKVAREESDGWSL